MNTLGIDIGSTYIKSAVISTEKEALLFTRSFPSLPKLPSENPLIYEWDAELLFNNVNKIIMDILDSYSIDGILLSTQMHGFIYHTAGTPDRYISWQDSRCLDKADGERTFLDTIRMLFPNDDMIPSGVSPKPSLGMCNLFALLNGKEAPSSDGTLYTLGSYLIYRLTGNNVCHITNAAPLGFADIQKKVWRSDMIEKLSFSNITLPVISPDDFTPVGFLDHSKRQIPVYPDYGDQQVCVLGSCAGSGDVIINIATACQLSVITSAFHPGEYEVRPYFEGSYLNTFSNMPGGRNLAVLIDLLKESVRLLTGEVLTDADIWNHIGGLSLPEHSLLDVNTYFYPTQDKNTGGKITGITSEDLTLENLFKGAYEHMAAEYAEHLLKLDHDGAITSIVFSGGVSFKNPALLSTTADKIKMPYSLAPVKDEAFNGLYRISQVIAQKGVIPDVSLKTVLTK